MSGYSPKHSRVLLSQSNGDHAYVVIDNVPPSPRYLYGVHCVRVGEEWFECGGSSLGVSGCGWSASDSTGSRGTWSLHEECPAHADVVRVEFEGEIREYPIVEGVCLAVYFNKPPRPEPRVTEMRIDSEWRAWR